MKNILISLVLLSALSVTAQEDYLITPAGDTLYGEITFSRPTENEERIILKNTEGKQSFSSNKISMCFIDNETYKSILYEPKYRIMKLVHPGYLSIYSFREDNSYGFGSTFLHNKSQQGIEVSSIGFKRHLSTFFKDCPDLARAIENKKYKISDLEQIVDYYNTNCLEESEDQPTGNVEPLDINEIAELQEILEDILTRRSNNESIPKYLIDALGAYTEKDVNGMLDQLLKEIDKRN